MEVPTLSEFINYIGGPLGVVAVFVFVSDLIRNLDWDILDGLPAWALQLITLALSAGVSLSCLALVDYVSPEQIALFEDEWLVLATLAVAYLNQQNHFRKARAGDNASVDLEWIEEAVVDTDAG